MADQRSNVTLVWAHTPQRWLAFRHYHMAGIDFGVERDLSGMPEDEVAATLQELELSSTVISEFNRLIHDRTYAVERLYARHSRESGNPVTEIVNAVSDWFTIKLLDSGFRRNDDLVISSA